MRPCRSPVRLVSLLALTLLLALATSASAAPAQDQDSDKSSRLPPPAPRPVDFLRDVQPILEASCARCHGYGKDQGRFRLDSRDTLLAGGRSGEPAAVPGDSAASPLIHLVAGLDPDRIMPKKGRRLEAREIAVLRAWVDQGLPWPEEFGFTRAQRAERIALRRPPIPEVPEGSGLSHPVDRFLAPYFAAHRIEPPPPASDRIFARRVSLDTIGLLPEPRELAAFLADRRPDKRARLVRRLLADSGRYAEHWLTFWNDALRNDYRGTGYIDGGRQQITRWLLTALRENYPFDRFVRELISPRDGSEGFIKGIVWRGVVNASQQPPVQAAQNVAQVFLGINLKCASCHDSFINNWKLADAYAFANIFAEEPLEIHRCDRPTGERAGMAFLYPELGTIDPAASRKERLEALTGIITSPRNGRLARTAVNRLWARFFGRGLVEPLDETDGGEPWHPDLLDWLASDLADSGWDLKHTMELILTSRAYSLPSVALERPLGKDFVFSGPLVRHLSAEEFTDALGRLTGVWKSLPEVPLEHWLGDPAGTSAPRAPESSAAEPATRHGFVRTTSGVIERGHAEIDADIAGARSLWLVVTEGRAGRDYDWADWGEPRLVGPAGTKRLTELTWRQATTGHGKVEAGKNAVGHPLRLEGREVAWGLGTHAHSVIVYDLPEGYERFQAAVGPDLEAIEKSPQGGHEVAFHVLADVQVRGALTAADRLMRALGRPNREQVVTRRESEATTLQALELTNGPALHEWLAEGARRWLTASDPPPPAAELARRAYLRALGRDPGPEELEAARELLESGSLQEGLEDLLWALTMVPEFQLIY